MKGIKVEALACLFVYFIIAVPALYIFSVVTPVFQVPDEPHHFMRAYQVSNFELFPQKRKTSGEESYQVGGLVDKGIIKVDNILTSIIFDARKKLTDDLQAKAGWHGWSGEKWLHTPNVSIYPPFFYIPAAIGITISKKNKHSIVNSVTFSRWCNITVGILLVSWAIVLSGESALLLTFFLVLPMTISQMASVSQDSLMLPVAALLAAFLGKLMTPSSLFKVFFYSTMSVVSIIMLSTSRPPYSALALILALLAHRQAGRDCRVLVYIASLVAIVCSFLWAYYVAKFVSVPFSPDSVNYSGQIGFILANPIGFVKILVANIVEYWSLWLAQMIGILGWLDTPLPRWYYYFTFALLALLVLFHLVERRGEMLEKNMVTVKAAITTVIFFSFIGCMTVIYIGFSPVGGDKVLGLQGRYLLPLFFVSSVLARGDNTHVPVNRWSTVRLAILCISGATGVAVSITGVFMRFYS